MLDDLHQIPPAVRLRTPDLCEPVPQSWGKLDIPDIVLSKLYNLEKRLINPSNLHVQLFFPRTNLFLAKVSTRVHSGDKSKFLPGNDELNVVIVAAAFLCQDQRFLRLKDTAESQGMKETHVYTLRIRK